MVRGLGVEAWKIKGPWDQLDLKQRAYSTLGIVLLIVAFCLFGWNLCPNAPILGGIESAILEILYTEAWFKSVQLTRLYPFNPVTFPADKPYWQKWKGRLTCSWPFLPQTPFPRTVYQHNSEMLTGMSKIWPSNGNTQKCAVLS